MGQDQEETKKKDDGAFKNRDIQIAKMGTKIVLPADPREMTENEAIEALTRIKAEREKVVGVHEEVDAFPLEGAWALRKVLEKMYGYVVTAEPMKMFGMTIPACHLVTLETGFGTTEQVIWGKFGVPGVEGEFQTSAGRNNKGHFQFVISGKVKLKDQKTIKTIVDEVRAYISANSLYRGQAIKISTTEKEGQEGQFEVDFNNPPSFMDLTRVNEAELVFSDDVQSIIETNLYTPIERTQECRDAKIPLKRSVLLEGPFGTGKTLAAYVTAKKAVRHQWTFIYMDRAQALKDVLIFARKYAPVVVFGEDIEQVTSGGRDSKVNDVLNNIDGIDSKGHEVICVFTTNNIEKIEPAMLRPGRLDVIVSVLPPDAKAAERLIRVYGQALVAKDEDLSGACQELAGQIPAFIREAVESAKLFAINKLPLGEKLTKLPGDAIRLAAIGKKRHFALVNKTKPKPLTAGDELALAMVKVLGSTTSEGDAGHYDTLDSAITHRNDISNQTKVLAQ
jgi:transitional endoplasmic reticulum ATPase